MTPMLVADTGLLAGGGWIWMKVVGGAVVVVA